MKHCILETKPKFVILEKSQVRVKRHMTKTKQGRAVPVMGYIREQPEGYQEPEKIKKLKKWKAEFERLKNISWRWG